MSIRHFFLSLAFLCFSYLSFAETIYTTVFNVVPSRKQDSILVLSSADGRIYKARKNPRNLKKLNEYIGQTVKIDYSVSGTQAFIQNISLVQQGEVDSSILDLNHFQYNELRKFAPTELKSSEQAVEIFNNLLNDGDKSISQCYKRAHVWAYDMWSKRGVYSEKVFIFYTRRYINLEEFDWWFHVAPVVTVNNEKIVLDGTFLSKPVTLKEWKDHFIRTDKITCPIVENFFDYQDHQWSRLCYLMITPMYYYDPLSIENRDNGQEKRNHWVFKELQYARKAFWNWANLYEVFNTRR